jgi:hypothetical protein
MTKQRIYLDDFRYFDRYIHGMFSIACEYPRCLQSFEWQVVSSFYSHLRETREKKRATLSGRKQSSLYRPRRAAADPREIMVQSSASHPFIPLPPPNRDCVIILKDHSNNRTKEKTIGITEQRKKYMISIPKYIKIYI